VFSFRKGYVYDTITADRLLVSECIIRPVVSVYSLTWFIRYVYYQNLQFLIYVIIIKTKVLLHQVLGTLVDFDYSI
jgi:hypothetical protein